MSNAEKTILDMRKQYKEIKHALEKGKHVLCESPIALNKKECEELYALAKKKELVLMEAIDERGFSFSSNMDEWDYLSYVWNDVGSGWCVYQSNIIWFLKRIGRLWNW